MFSRKHRDSEDLSKYLHRYGVSSEKARRFESKMSEIAPADYFLPESEHVYVGYDTPLDLELGVLSQIVQHGLDTILDPIICSPVVARRLFGPAGLGTLLETASKDFFYGRVAAFALTSVGPSTFRACYAAFRLRQLIKSRSVSIKVISNPSLTLYRVVIAGVDRQVMVYDPFINPTKVFNEKFHKSHVLNLYPESDETNVLYQFNVTPEICEDLTTRLEGIESTMRILLAESNSVQRFMQDEDYVESLEGLDMLPEDYEAATEFALNFLAAKIQLPKAARAISEKQLPLLETQTPTAALDEVLPVFDANLDLSVYIAREIDDDRPLFYTKYHGELASFSALIRAREKQREVSMALFSDVIAALKRRGIDVAGRICTEDDSDCRMWIDAAMMFVGAEVRNSFCMTAYAAFMIDKIFYAAALERNKWDEIPVITIMEAGFAGRYVVAIGRVATDEWSIYDPLHDASRVMSVPEYEEEVFVQAGKLIGVINTCILIGHGERAQFAARLKDEVCIKRECEAYQEIQKKLTILFTTAPALPKKGDSAQGVDELVNKIFPLPTPLRKKNEDAPLETRSLRM